MEAMAMGRPVIGTNIRGTRDLLKDGGGMLVPPGDVVELARAMDWIAEHPTEARKMGREGLSQVQKYRIENVLKMHEELYDELLST